MLTEFKSYGLSLIEDERIRQIVEEGWTPQHDQKVNPQKNLVRAAICYLYPSRQYEKPQALPKSFPWLPKWWKPTMQYGLKGRIREIVKGGALIKAEMDRIWDRYPHYHPLEFSDAQISYDYGRYCFKNGLPEARTNDTDFYLNATIANLDMYMATEDIQYLSTATALCAMQIDLLMHINKTHQENLLKWL